MRSRLGIIAIVGLGLALAWAIRFGTDDAYISFNYARSLVRGDGLTWFGTHVEGYTNFSWVLWIAAGLAAGADPLHWAWAGSLAALVVAIVVTYRIAKLRTGNAVAGACAAAILATNFTFLAFGTSGLETMLQTTLLAVATWQIECLRRVPPTAARLAGLSITCAFAMWTRLDSAVICAVLGAVAAHRLATARASARVWIAAIVPALVLVGGWLAWKLAYYGDILPNTYYVKVGTGRVAQGARYAGEFLHAYALWPLLVLAAAVAAVRRAFVSRLPAALAATWFAYVIAVGGDFMEYRFFVPILPALATIIAELVTIAPDRRPSPALRAFAVIALLAAWSLRHAARFEGADGWAYDNIRKLATFYGRVPDGDWARLGRPLRTALAGTDATLACNGAGAIPYYAELPTVDQLGLNDPWIARHGIRPPADYRRPGHQRFAPYDYLVQRGVTFVIGSPTLVVRGSLSTRSPAVDYWIGHVLGPIPTPLTAIAIVAAPVDNDLSLLLWYLTPSAEITSRIQAAHWETVTLEPHAR